MQAALQIEPSVAVQGVSSLFLFRVRLASQPPAGGRVLLHLSPAADAVGDLVGMMYDDGDFSHRDDRAGDLVYSAAFSYQLGTLGSFSFVAVVTAADGTVLAKHRASLTVKAPVPDATVQTRISEGQGIQLGLEQRITAGVPIQQAIVQITQTVVETGADPASIITTGRGIQWTTPEGIGMVALVHQAGEKSFHGLDVHRGAGSGMDSLLLPSNATARRMQQAHPGTKDPEFGRPYVPAWAQSTVTASATAAGAVALASSEQSCSTRVLALAPYARTVSMPGRLQYRQRCMPQTQPVCARHCCRVRC